MPESNAFFAGVKTLAAWKATLLPTEVEAITERFPYADDSTELYTNEVFDAIVAWNGGLSSSWEIRGLVSRIYGVDLG